MKSKAALSLMEQAIMVLVLAVAAAVCLRVFAYADILSRQNTAVDAACVRAQSAAETLKGCGGDLSLAAASYGGSLRDGGWVVGFDRDWQQTEGAAEYTLRAEILNSGTEYLGEALISVSGDGELFSLTVRWQEA